MTNKQKKKNRNSRDSYGRLLANGWHLEVSRAEININNDGIPIVLSADIHGCDYHGSCFSQTMIPPTQLETHDKRTEMHACDLIDRQALMKEFSDFVRASNNSDFARTPTWNDAVSLVGSMPSAQPEPYLDSIVSEIENTISETKKSGRHHEIHIRTNGEMICYGLQLALEIIEEKGRRTDECTD